MIPCRPDAGETAPRPRYGRPGTGAARPAQSSSVMTIWILMVLGT